MSDPVQELSVLVAAAEAALRAAEEFATEHKLSFHFSPAYGMGGSFHGDEVGEPAEWGDPQDGWFPSSQSC